MRRVTKDASEELDWTEDWSSWLGNDTIQSSSWTIPAGLTEVSSTNTSTAATIWISGGTNQANYVIKNAIATSGGRDGVRSFLLSVIRK